MSKLSLALIIRPFIVCVLITCASCVHESAIPLGNDMMEINVSAASVYGRAGAQRIALAKAAKATLAMGYDKFVIVNSNGWNEATFNAGSYGQASVNSAGGQASQGSYANTMRHPESKLIIHMYHAGDVGAEKAVDAHGVLELNKD